MSLLVIAYPTLSDADRVWLQAIRESHDSENWNLIDPHFTLIFPCDPPAEVAVCEQVRAIGRVHRAFPFVLRRLIVHEEAGARRRLLFAEPEEGRAEIIALHDDLYSGILKPYLRRDLPYRPHITIATCEERTSCEAIIERIGGSDIAIRGTIETLDVVRLDDEGITPVATVRLE